MEGRNISLPIIPLSILHSCHSIHHNIHRNIHHLNTTNNPPITILAGMNAMEWSPEVEDFRGVAGGLEEEDTTTENRSKRIVFVDNCPNYDFF